MTRPALAAASTALPQSPWAPFLGKLLVKGPGHGQRRTWLSSWRSSSPLILSWTGRSSAEARPLLCHREVSCQARPLDSSCHPELRQPEEVSCQPLGRSSQTLGRSCQALPLLCHQGSGSLACRQERVVEVLTERRAIARKKRSVRGSLSC